MTAAPLPTEKRLAAVEKLQALGWSWTGDRWVRLISENEGQFDDQQAGALGEPVEWQKCEDSNFSGNFDQWERISRAEYVRLAAIFKGREVVRLGALSFNDGRRLVERADGWPHKIRALYTARRQPAVPDPHHGGSYEWRWMDGKLHHRLRGSSHKWVECRRVSVTPRRILAIAAALQQP